MLKSLSLKDIDGKLASDVRGIVVRLGTTLDEKTLTAFTHLQWVATITTGTDHIDEGYLARRNISLLSLKGEFSFLESIHATPEHTWGLLLALLRNIPAAYESVRRGNWNRQDFEGTELFGKNLGIVGFGRVGKIIGQYAQAFGMNVLATDTKELPSSIRQVSLETLLRESDVVTLHVPLEASTRNLIGEKEFSLMKPSAVLVNTSRGSVINEKALLDALKQKKLSGAALDVLAGETTGQINEHHPLISYANHFPNLVLSPHIAGSTFDSLKKTARFIAQKLVSAHLLIPEGQSL